MTKKASENRNASDEICEECGAVVAQGKAGCLKLFGEILAREFSDYRLARELIGKATAGAGR